MEISTSRKSNLYYGGLLFILLGVGLLSSSFDTLGNNEHTIAFVTDVDSGGVPDNHNIDHSLNYMDPTEDTGPDTDEGGEPDSVDLGDDNDGILDTFECTTSSFMNITPVDFGFPSGVLDGSLMATELDISSKWGLPEGSILISVHSASTLADGRFAVNSVHRTVFELSGSVPVLINGGHSEFVSGLEKDGIVALDGTQYLLENINLPSGIVAGNDGNDYFVENTTTSNITNVGEYRWRSQSTSTKIQFYASRLNINNVISIEIAPQNGNINAVDDDFTDVHINGATGGVLPDSNVLDNDTLNGHPVDPEDILLTSESTGGVTINHDGTITIDPGTPVGEVIIEYTICEVAYPESCDTASATVFVCTTGGIDAVDDDFTDVHINGATGGVLPDSNVLDNDTLNGHPVDPEDIILTSEPTGGVTINHDGTITIAPGTPVGEVIIEYTICEVAHPESCDTASTTVFVCTTAGIDAVDDDFAVNTGSSGVLPGINVLDNDTFNGHPVDPEDITLTSETSGGVTINPDGTITIAEGTPDGEIVIEYTICAVANPADCDTATVTITIGPLPVIDAVDDDFAVETGSSGQQQGINVLDNDTLDGEPLDPADIALTFEITSNITINPDGTITIAEGAPDGVVVVTYTICENTNPANCDTAVVIITIGIPPVIDAVVDEFSVDSGTSGLVPDSNVLDNDTLGGEPVDPADITLTSESTGGVTINPDGTITIAEGTPDGVVFIEYTICQNAFPANCDTATVTINIGVDPVLIVAEDDTFDVATGTSGAIQGANVLSNDTLGGDPVDVADITLTSESTGGVTINPDGTITIAEGTPDGQVEVEYTICQNTSPANCDTATVTINIGVDPVPIVAEDDTFDVATGTSGAIQGASVLSNDTLGGEPVDPADITLTSESTGGVTINPDGTITIAEGTPDGQVEVEYTICQNTSPTNCDTATVTINIGVDPVPIVAEDDTFDVATGTSGAIQGASVLSNDTLGGEPVDPADITLTSESTGGVTINPDGTITIAEGTPDGQVEVEYTICQNTSPTNCDTATVTINIGVDPVPIVAEDDTFDVAIGTSGAIQGANVLSNDTLGGDPVDAADITLTSESTGGVTINPDGTITITEGTPDGQVEVEYTICQNTSPANCDTATVTIIIVDPVPINCRR